MDNNGGLISVIEKHFQHVTDLGNGVLRGERIHADKPFAVAYIDISDSVIERSEELMSFQEKLLGDEYFSSNNDLRWNSYLYFLAGPKSKANSQFSAAKSRIEEDRHYARKFVLDVEDFARRLGEPTRTAVLPPIEAQEIGSIWADLFRSESLSSLLQQRPRTETLVLIETGKAFRAETNVSIPTLSIKNDVLKTGFLRTLSIGTFRNLYNDKTFGFGDVNLVVGANGTGKTSLLEAIEILYCGRVRRDPDAKFEKIAAKVQAQDGTVRSVNATTNAKVLKARNLTWYGRADFQASAISQAFTRFNFLDTDAAFRMSSDNNSEQLREDLSRLLIGAETAKLWDYISKLSGDVSSRLSALQNYVLSNRRTTELLSDEVKRLRSAPSEANTLLKEFRSNLRLINVNWVVTDDEAPLDPNERTKLQLLLKSLESVIASTVDVPVTPEKVKLRLANFREKLDLATRLHIEHDATVKLGAQAEIRVKEQAQHQSLVEDWLKLVESDVPSRMSKLTDSELRTSYLRSLLRDLISNTPSDVPVDYAHLTIKDALKLAREKLEEANSQEEAATLALSQSVQLGEKLEALRQDLHDASLAYMQRSGEMTLCPVCKTEHITEELLKKIESLVASDASNVVDSLRSNVLAAKERHQQERAVFAHLTNLELFCENLGLSETLLTEHIQHRLRQANEDLKNAEFDIQRHKVALDELSLSGVDWQGWENMRRAVSTLLPPAGNPDSLSVCKQALEEIKQSIRTEVEEMTKIPDKAADLARQSINLLTDEISIPTSGQTPLQIKVSMERMLEQSQSAIEKVSSITETVSIDHDQSLDDLQLAVQSCILSYDKASHAFASDTRAKDELVQKEKELKSVIEAVNGYSKKREFITRANNILTEVVNKHSLKKATEDSFSAIKDNVGDVFAQIHSPPEYVLGDLGAGQLVVKREDGQSHAANQVSTGQRAALALSIFLALNDSAKTAPPVILIDDPIAHIDDLNALSFLDYLREVALNSRKQIFFATADARLAALFQRKFEFLGKQRFKIISLASQDA